MWRRLNTLCLWGIFSSVTFQNAVLNCDTMRKTDFSSPNLNSNTNSVMMGQNVSLFCSHNNGSLQIMYSLFLNTKFLVSKEGKGEPVAFNLTISTTNDLGPYKCKAQAGKCSTYSGQFNFTVSEGHHCPTRPWLPLLLPGLLVALLTIILALIFWLLRNYKARKAARARVPKDSGARPVEGEVYENVCETPAGRGHTPEIHYATPVFLKAAPRKPEACQDFKTDCAYSEFTF